MATCTGDQYVENIERTECIGNSLVKINNNFAALDVAVCETGNDIESLLTLINQLSSNMQNIGNYPYLEYAWVGTPNSAPETLTGDVLATLLLNTEVADTGNFGSINPSTNQFTLAPGTYQYSAFSPIIVSSGTYAYGKGIFSLNAVTPNPRYISRTEYHGGGANTVYVPNLNGQFQIGVSTTFDIKFLPASTAWVSPNGAQFYNTPAVSFGATNGIITDGTQRTTIKLWKVG